jgi:CopG family nickel-responsive transcriptional regulator
MDEVQRFGISMPKKLLEAFDGLIAQQGYDNRSEAIRDMVRDCLLQRQWELPDGEVVGTLTIVYDHHTRGIEARLVDIQHDYGGQIRCTTHVHLDYDNCIEVMVVQGQSDEVRRLADTIISLRGVKHGQLTCTGIVALIGQQSEHTHHHDHDHTHHD